MKNMFDLVVHCYNKLGVHYLYAAKGEIATRNKIISWSDLYPSYYTSSRKNKALQYAGDIATDCSGLISWLTGIIRSSQGYYNTAVMKGTITSIPEIPGLAVWRKGHIGIYIGNGSVIEAKGMDYGVVKTKLSTGTWTHWIKLKDIVYDYTPVKDITKTSPKIDIMWAQWRLNLKRNAGLEIDGIYGTKTIAAYKGFARARGWTKPEGGYIGKNGRAALNR